MKRLSVILLSALVLCQAPAKAQREVSIREVASQEFTQGEVLAVTGQFMKAMQSGTEIKLLLRDSTYVIPVEMENKDGRAELRYLATRLQPGDTIKVQGEYKAVMQNKRSYPGLSNVAVVSKGGEPLPDSADDSYVAPKFQGGPANDFALWVNRHLRYPHTANKGGHTGMVVVQFVVTQTGAIDSVQVVKPSGAQALDNEALRVIEKSPKWTPGTIDGKPVSVTLQFPVIFALIK